MPVFRKDQEPPANPAQATYYSAPRALTAAAARVNLSDKDEAELFKNRRNSSVSAWQAEAWEYYDAIGEIKYALNLVANVVSRIRLYAAIVEDPAETPVPLATSTKVSPNLSGAAERALERLNSAYGGQAGLLRDAALNLSVTGECYLVQMPEKIGTGVPEAWDIRSTDELNIDAQGNYFILPRRETGPAMGGSAKGRQVLPQGAFVGRMWRAHPRYSDEPDSSLKGLLDLCAELLLLNRTFRATAKSRLNAGAMYIPDGLTQSNAIDPDGLYGEEDPTADEAADEFEEQLIDAMTTPIEDESSAAAVVPLIIRGPAELGEKIKMFKFERSFDAELAKRADRVLERILQGLDVPKDTVTGLANVKYSNAVQIDESLYKAHIEPLLLLISDALTVAYLRPYLRSIGHDEAEVQRCVIWYDPSSVATRNDRAADADSGFDKMAISFDTWRRAHGFSDADAPEPTELALRLLVERASFTPELTESLLAAVAPDVINAARQASQANSVAPIPPEVQQVLQGNPAAAPTAAPEAAEPPTEGTEAVEPVEDAPDVTPEEEVEAGESAPPFLAEPEDVEDENA